MANFPNANIETGVLDRAREFAHQYRLIITPKVNGFILNAVELPGIIIENRTVEGAVTERQGVLTEKIARMLREGRVPPSPSVGRRSEQINVKISLEERALLESAARAKGNRGIADYLRQAGLDLINRNV